MLRTAMLIYLALAALCSACVEAWSMTQPMEGRFPSGDWAYWHPIVFTLSVALLGVAAGLIHVRRRWWVVMAALAPLIIGGVSLLRSSRSLILGCVIVGAAVLTVLTIVIVPGPRHTVVGFALSLFLALWWIPTLIRWVPEQPYIDERPAIPRVPIVLAAATPVFASFLLRKPKAANA